MNQRNVAERNGTEQINLIFGGSMVETEKEFDGTLSCRRHGTEQNLNIYGSVAERDKI